MSDGGTETPWYAEFDDELKGAVSNMGLDKLTPVKAAEVALKSFRETQKKLGIPADQVIRVPRDMADAEAMKPVWAKLGVPEKPEDYDFSTVKRPDGSAILDADATFVRNLAFRHNIPKTVATALAADLLKHGADSEAEAATLSAAGIAARHAELQSNWGDNYPTNKFVADRTMALLGYSQEEIRELERRPDYPAKMEIMRQRGVAMGEAALVGHGDGRGGAGNGVVTREGAHARMQELKGDKAWFTRWQAGDKGAVDEWKSLSALSVRR